MIDFSSEKYSGSTGHGTPGTSREIYSEDADGEIRMRSQSQLRNDKYIMIQNLGSTSPIVVNHFYSTFCDNVRKCTCRNMPAVFIQNAFDGIINRLRRCHSAAGRYRYYVNRYSALKNLKNDYSKIAKIWLAKF